VKKFKNFLFAISLISLFYLITPNRLYAYLDAGTGSYMIQIIIAIAIGGAFGIKIFWRKIYSISHRLFSKKRNNIEQEKVEINEQDR